MSVEALSMLTFCIAAAADLTAFSPPAMLGSYLRCEMATVLSSGVDARYFFSTERVAAARGLASTHLAAFRIARVAAAAAFGLSATNFPFATTAQQYSLAKGSSTAWSATFFTFP